MSFQFSVLLLQLRRKRNFVANANNFWVSSCSVKILDHTTECILLETNSQKKLCWWMHARDRPGLGGILAATWRRWPGRNLPGLCRGPLDTPHSGKIRQRTSLTVWYFCFLFSSHLCLCVCFRAKIKRFAMCVMRVRGAMTRWVHMWGMGASEPSCCHQPVSPRVRVSPGTGRRHPPHLSAEKHSHQEITRDSVLYSEYETQITLILSMSTALWMPWKNVWRVCN